MLTLLTLAALIALVGMEHTFLIAIGALLIYLYPVQAILFLAFIGFLKWQGTVIKQKVINYIKRRKPK
ncbi:hypothetical protein [Dasania marina]|uniref:hypothetical protein n=1 Tax=Dasania marina TaxID=471499 RepID=UPI0030DAE732|tara:strand:- start:8261 stop:8464 length:204 start_codon:yes stop_codon:yes gene_type:complete